jgi:hypothetical protein
MSEELETQNETPSSTSVEGEVITESKPKRSRRKPRKEETQEIVIGMVEPEPTPEAEAVVEPSAPPEPELVAPSPLLPPKTWLTLTSFGVLQVVQTSNYLRYGPAGVRRFYPGAPLEAMPHPGIIHVKMTLKQPGSGELVVFPHLHLSIRPPGFDLGGTNIWVGGDESARLQVSWVWDFYRLFSGVKLRVEVPSEATDTPEWESAYNTLRTLNAGGQIILEASGSAGDLLQVYPIDKTAQETHSAEAGI